MGFNRLIKQINALKTGYSYLLDRITRRSIISGMPVAAGIEISGKCNLRCPECSLGAGVMTREGGFMDIELFGKIINELGPFLYNINLYFQGEPMLHPRLFDFLEISKGTRVTVSTNGHFLSEENAEKLARSGLKKIIVSLDGMDQETYSLYRIDGEIEKVISGIEYLSQAIRRTGSSLKLEIQFLVNSHNEAQIPSAREFAKKVNAVLRLKSMQIINSENVDYWLPGNEKFRRYRKNTGNVISKNSLRNHCLRLSLNPVITWDGKVVPCCFDKDAEHIMGDLTVSSFRTIWKGEEYRKFRDSILTGRKNIAICRNCTSGLYGVIY
ncbi:MAG: radical SAM protein [Odoribacter sp.]|nr:radical SAM protein [Odoribacter sp.]